MNYLLLGIAISALGMAFYYAYQTGKWRARYHYVLATLRAVQEDLAAADRHLAGGIETFGIGFVRDAKQEVNETLEQMGNKQ